MLIYGCKNVPKEKAEPYFGMTFSRVRHLLKYKYRVLTPLKYNLILFTHSKMFYE